MVSEGEMVYVDLAPSAGGLGCTLNFQSRPVADFAQLQTRLRAAAKTPQQPGGYINPEKDAVIIRADSSVRWQHVTNAYNQAIAAGYHRVSFGSF